MEMVKLTVRLPKQLHQILRERAAQSARSLNRVIVDTLWRGLEREEAEFSFVSADNVLCEAARAEGLPAENPNEHE